MAEPAEPALVLEAWVDSNRRRFGDDLFGEASPMDTAFLVHDEILIEDSIGLEMANRTDSVVAKDS